MICYLKHDDINKTLWDECIAHAPNGNVYAWSWYLDIVHPGWGALIEMRHHKYLTVMPITGKKKYGIKYLCQPFFSQQLGVFSILPLTQRHLIGFLRRLPKNCWLVQIRLNEGNPIDASTRGVEMHQNHLLDLNKSYDKLYYDYHDNTCRNLKKSLKYGPVLEKGVPIAKVIELFRSNRGASVRHWGDAEYERLTRLAETALKKGNAFVYGVKNQGSEEIVCGALFMVSHQRVTFLFSGNGDAGKDTQAMTFLLDQVVQAYAGQPMTLDFEGSDDANLARFYQGFGSQTVFYPGLNLRLFNPF